MQAHATHVPAVADGFLPHGYCYLWDKSLLATHLISDLLIGVSYVVISFALAALVHRARRDIPFHVLFVAFGLFIVTCGMTHFMEVWTLWRPVYWLSGGVKLVTAAASVATAAAMPFMLPRVHTTIRDARLARERELASARAAALAEQNALLEAQAGELARQREEACALAGELERTNAELRRVAAEAEESRRAADAANRAKSEFLAVMSHELRTPLNAIGGYTELIEMGLRGPVTEAQREDLGRIRRSQLHLVSLISDILDFSRIEAAGVSYSPAAIRLRDVLTEVHDMIAPGASRRSVTLRLGQCAERVTAWADGEKVRQIALNLLSNAIKYTPAGGRVELCCGVDGGRAYVRVTDTGIGIPRDQQEMVFEPFVQLDRGLTRTTEGTGLGLSISRRLAAGMGGELTLDSEEGAGSTFTLWLPTAERRIAA
jgi:signal transduction histidine kinase